MFAGQVIEGACVSLIVTVNVQALVRPLVSVAVQVTVVTPLAKVEALAGEQATATPGQLSVAPGNAHVTFDLVHWPASVMSVMFAGQALITGVSVSLIVTVNAQALVFPAPSVAVQVTVVT